MQRPLTYLHSKLSSRFEPSVESWKLHSSIQQICPRLHTAKVVLISIMRALSPDRYFKEMTQTMATQAANMTSHVSNLVEGSEETSQLQENIRKLEEILCHILIFVQSETQSTLLWMEDLCIQNRYYVLTAQLKEITQTFERAAPKLSQAEDQVISSTCLKNNPLLPVLDNRGSLFQNARGVVIYGGTFSSSMVGEEANYTEGIVSGRRVIKVEDVSLQREILKGKGYRLHSAECLGKVVVVKVFEGNRTKERSSKEACFYREVWHPNVTVMIGVSPLKSDCSFLVFDGGCDGPLDYILGQALKRDLRGSLIMGLETVVGLSSGLDYLHGLIFPVASIGLEHFVLLYSRGRITISFDPEGLDNIFDLQLRNIDSALDLFHALCQKTFDAACKNHYEGQQIQRTESYINEDGITVYEASTKDSNDIEQRGHEEAGEGEILDKNASINLDLPRNADLPSDMSNLVPSVAPGLSSIQRTPIQRKQEKLPPIRKPEESSPSRGRRQELVWQIPAEENITLNQISREFQHFLKVNASSTKPYLDRRRGRYTKRTAHRCPGYNRIEITLTADITRSAIISHSTPIPHEICPVCKEVVQDAEIFNCTCGREDDESIATVMCSKCFEWHHRPCVAVDFVDREPHKFVCKRCCQLSEGPIPVLNEWTVPGKHLTLPVSPALEVSPKNSDRVTKFGTKKKTFLKRTWVKRLSDSVGTFIQSRQIVENWGSTPGPYVRDPVPLPPVSPGLPSQVDETLAPCPRLRILVVGKSGVGKSSLVKSTFGIDPDKIDISHYRAEKADIDCEYTSPENPRFILHDSQGFQADSDGNCAKVEVFLESRQKNDLPGRIHAIWLCLETPLTGSRLLQKGDERMLQLAKKFNIPIIAVFTKYDVLETLFYKDNGSVFKSERLASESFDCLVQELKRVSPANLSISCVKVSTKDSKQYEYIINLMNVTLRQLQNVEELRVLCAIAHQANVRQKVDVSISEGSKKYWLDLGESSAFEGHILIDCIHRLHDDVLKVWNFNDPAGILSCLDFFTEMIGLVKPLIGSEVDESSFGTKYVAGFGTIGATLLVPRLLDFGLSDLAIHYLYDEYQQHPSTAKLLATYIINLVLILHDVFTDNLISGPPGPLSKDIVFKNVGRYKADSGKEIFDNVDLVPEFATHPEQVIKRVITRRLSMY